MIQVRRLAHQFEASFYPRTDDFIDHGVTKRRCALVTPNRLLDKKLYASKKLFKQSRMKGNKLTDEEWAQMEIEDRGRRKESAKWENQIAGGSLAALIVLSLAGLPVAGVCVLLAGMGVILWNQWS